MVVLRQVLRGRRLTIRRPPNTSDLFWSLPPKDLDLRSESPLPRFTTVTVCVLDNTEVHRLGVVVFRTRTSVG